jgi:D-arabinose 1-dehydrogenase-like Zn-dependent alcohol dehydrogenase
LVALIDLLVTSGVRPLIDTSMPLDQARHAFERMISGDLFGKLVLTEVSRPRAVTGLRPVR